MKQTVNNKTSIIFTISVVLAVIWGVFVINFVTGGWLNSILSVKPRDLFGALGIFTFSFAHSDLGHIVANSVPFFILSLLVALNGGVSRLFTVWILGALGSGIGIWLLGSSGQVVGASGVVFALNGFILARSYYNPNLTNIAVAVITLFLYSSVLFSLLHFNAVGISWMGHIGGFIAGIVTALLLSDRRKQLAKTD